MTTKELLISRLNQLSEEDIASLLDTANHMEGKNTLVAKTNCPYYGSYTVIRYGHKCRKQRFFQPPIPSCQIHISRQRHGVKSSLTQYIATPLTTLHKRLAVPTRRSLI